jgi:hypothetical protein
MRTKKREVSETYEIENESRAVIDLFMDFIRYAVEDGTVLAVMMSVVGDRKVTITFND